MKLPLSGHLCVDFLFLNLNSLFCEICLLCFDALMPSRGRAFQVGRLKDHDFLNCQLLCPYFSTRELMIRML